MFIEQITITNFRCFGPNSTTINLSPDLNAFVGLNGSGKTAIMLALLRLFGVTSEQKRLRRQDFHIPAAETSPPDDRKLSIEVLLRFPELESEGEDQSSIPEFFHQMIADSAGCMLCRLRLEATWTDDGSLDGFIEQRVCAIRKLGTFEEDDRIELKAIDRSRIQVIYVPATRDGSSQVTTFLRGRLWRAINWSDQLRREFANTGKALNNSFAKEPAVSLVTAALEKRWREVHSAETDTTPVFRPVDLRFQEFIRNVEAVFQPDEAGRDRSLEDLSDGQRSLFHLAVTAATLDTERELFKGRTGSSFRTSNTLLPALTLLAIEEPENNLAPFYLSRIIRQIENLTAGHHAQAFISSHSPSILARIDPASVRYFRLDHHNRTTQVRSISLPTHEEEAAKFIREAVRTFPELYFSKFVILGEGSSEEVVLPKLAEALGLPIDRSFVAVVPLGGRHVNHLWRLLSDLEIPHATLLDLDVGRHGGGWGRIKTACEQLLARGVAANQLFRTVDPAGAHINLSHFDQYNYTDQSSLLNDWVNYLRTFNIYFCTPLDLDFSMLTSLPLAYQRAEGDMVGPSPRGDALSAVLGENGNPAFYKTTDETIFRWYRYLFLGRGKPSTHLRVLGRLLPNELRDSIPEVLKSLLDSVASRITSKPASPSQ